MGDTDEVTVEEMLKVMKKKDRASLMDSIAEFFMAFFALMAVAAFILIPVFLVVSMPGAKMVWLSVAGVFVSACISASVAIYHHIY